MKHVTLKSYQREHRDSFGINLSLRTHRGLSWLDRAEQCESDLDAKFIFLWIAFNACYAVDVDQEYRDSEKSQFKLFFDKITSLDNDKLIYDQLWKTFSSTIRVLLDNRYVYQPFWDFHNKRTSGENWEERFKYAKNKAAKSLARQDTSEVLSIVFERLYTLRNQLVHGGATWNSQANRDQLKECTLFLGTVVPLIIHIMMTHPNTLWGTAHYPVIEG